MYGISRFAEKLNTQNCENSTGNCVYYMHGKIKYTELRIFNEKLCTLYMYGMFGYAEKLNV